MPPAPPAGQATGEQTTGATTLLHFGKASLPQHRMSIPQQDNGCDCGLFLLSHMQRFISPSMPAQLSAAEILSAFRGDTPPPGSSLPVGFLRNDWFVTEEAALLRSTITLLILEQLRAAQTDPEVAKREGMPEATVERYAKQHNDIDMVMDEVRERIGERTENVSRAEARLEKRRVREAAAKAAFAAFRQADSNSDAACCKRRLWTGRAHQASPVAWV